MSRKDRRAANARDSRSSSTDADALFSGNRRRSQERKERQLCAQAKIAITLTLEGECRDPLLDGALIDEVVFDNGQLITIVRVGAGADLAAITARLNAAKGLLRSAVAAAIHRKRTPSLGFVVLPDEAPR